MHCTTAVPYECLLARLSYLSHNCLHQSVQSQYRNLVRAEQLLSTRQFVVIDNVEEADLPGTWRMYSSCVSSNSIMLDRHLAEQLLIHLFGLSAGAVSFRSCAKDVQELCVSKA